MFGVGMHLGVVLAPLIPCGKIRFSVSENVVRVVLAPLIPCGKIYGRCCDNDLPVVLAPLIPCGKIPMLTEGVLVMSCPSTTYSLW